MLSSSATFFSMKVMSLVFLFLKKNSAFVAMVTQCAGW